MMFEKIKEKYYAYKKEFIKTVDKGAEWEILKGFRNDKFISSMYIWLFVVPLVRKFLSKLNENFPFKVNDRVYEVVLQAPFSWNMFFYAALCFSIGNIIYFLFSPKFIKLYRDYSQYFASERNINYLREILEKDFKNEIVKPIVINSASNNSKKDVDKNDFYDAYDKANKLNRATRLACAIAYVSGLCLFSVVMLQNIIWMIFH